jgi:hypothetical protein
MRPSGATRVRRGLIQLPIQQPSPAIAALDPAAVGRQILPVREVRPAMLLEKRQRVLPFPTHILGLG